MFVVVVSSVFAVSLLCPSTPVSGQLVNWKQCVWKQQTDKDSGKIRVSNRIAFIDFLGSSAVCNIIIKVPVILVLKGR